MSANREGPHVDATVTQRALVLSGLLLAVGFVVNAIQRMLLHPSGEEDDHRSIFTEYADSDVWVATHFAEFVLVLVAFAGFLMLCGALRREAPSLTLLAGGAIVIAGATWTALQAVDGITLKEAVDAWAAASPGAEQATRHADAEVVRWIEWGLQSYLRVVMGLAFLLLGGAVVASRRLPSWLGVALGLAGALSIAAGVSVGYAGLESGFQNAVGIAFQLAVLVFVFGLLAASRRPREATPSTTP